MSTTNTGYGGGLEILIIYLNNWIFFLSFLRAQEHAFGTEKINNYTHTLEPFKGLIIAINKHSYKETICTSSLDNMEIL